MTPLITSDAIIAGILMFLLAGIFYTSESEHPFFKKFYTFVPSLLLCYLFPALMNSFGVISAEKSQLYNFSSQYLLPAILVLLTSTADLRAIMRLGKTALTVFLAGTLGIILGGPFALWLVSTVSPSFHQEAVSQEFWKGLVTLSGSWIGGSSSQLVLKEIYGCSETLFTLILILDAVVANIWTACLFYGAAFREKIDRFLKADNSRIEEVQQRILAYQEQREKPAELKDIANILAIGFGGGALAHLGAKGMTFLLQPYAPVLEANGLSPFLSNLLWIVVLSTSIGIGLSFTKVRKLEKLGSTDFATYFMYFLIMTIGMKLNVFALGANMGLLWVVIIWMIFHVLVMFIVAKLMRAPFFFVAVGSQANIGGVATAPAVAAAFHPSLAPVGVLLAVFSHVLGTYGGILCAWLMQWVI